MSECGLWQTAKQTLCGLVLAACAATGIGCGSVPAVQVPQQQVEQPASSVLNEAINYLKKKDYSKAKGLFEQRQIYLLEEHNKIQALADKGVPIFIPSSELSISERILFAIAYAHTRDYNDSETQFTNALIAFKNSPQLVERVQKELGPYLTSPDFKNSESLLIWSTAYAPKMTGVLGFVEFVKPDNKKAYEFFKKAVPHFDAATVKEYRTAFARLIAHCYEPCTILNPDEPIIHDNATILRYVNVLAAAYSSDSQVPASLTDEEKVKDTAARRLVETYLRMNFEETFARAKELADLYNSDSTAHEHKPSATLHIKK